MAKELSPTKQKALLLLYSGALLSFAATPRVYFKVIAAASREWKKINERELKRVIRELYDSKLISSREEKSGIITLTLSEKGERKALSYKVEEMKISPMRWDNKWRMVLFDIPEDLKGGRNALREKLQDLGFVEYQKSVLVHPYKCKNEVDFIVEFFELRPYVRYLVADFLDNDLDLRHRFNL